MTKSSQIWSGLLRNYQKVHPRTSPPGASCAGPHGPERLHRMDFVGLHALLALHDLERNLLAFLQAAESRADDGTEVDEHVLTVLAADETETLGVVEPLD